MRRWLQQAAYLVACSRFGTNLTALAFLSRFGNMFLRPMAKGEGLWSLDGRTAHQWVASITAYLEWRQGRFQRGHDEHEYYLLGYRALMQAWLAPERDDPARLAELDAEALRLGLPVSATYTKQPAAVVPFPARKFRPRRAA